MNDTSFNKAFACGYFVTYTPALMPAYSPQYPGIYASNFLVQIGMHLHMLYLSKTLKKRVRAPGFEPEFLAWQAKVIPGYTTPACWGSAESAASF